MGFKIIKTKRKKKKTSNLILGWLGVFLFLFIVCMIVIYWVKGSVPDTLITCVLGAGGVEAFVLAGIKISKVLKGGKLNGNQLEAEIDE